MTRHRKTSPQRHVNVRLERWHRHCIYGVAIWLTATGLLWLLARYLLRPVGEFGESVHPLEPWSMQLHGAGAMVALFFLGSLMNSHIRRALKAEHNLYSGYSMIAVLAALTASGYGLYYLANEQSRPVWSAVHWILGLAVPLLLPAHIFFGRRRMPPDGAGGNLR